jgi:outer membrane protein OmpA-like peptidoglycan-associated protein
MSTLEPKQADEDTGVATPAEAARRSGSWTDRAGLIGRALGRRLAAAQPDESPVGEAKAPRGAGWAPPPWAAFLERARGELGESGSYDGLIWVGLILVLGLYGWLAVPPAPEVEPAIEPEIAETPTGNGPRVDAAVQRVLAEKASLERQIAEARTRIAALEEAVAAERQRGDLAGPAPPDATPAPGALPLLLAGLGGRATERGILIDLSESDLHFPIGQATLPDGDLPILDRIAEVLVQRPTLTARVEGYTDSSGREEVNLALSQARAEAVREALMKRGVGAGRIQATGYGEARPIADNATRAGRDRNRRIELYLIDAAD